MGLRMPSGRSVLVVALLAALAACDGGGGDGEPPPLGGTGTVRDDFSAMQSRLDGLFNTSFTPPDNAIPASGTAEFRGFMKVDVSGSTVPIDLSGNARITADFGAGTLVGTAQDFEGLQGNTVSAYAGTVSFVDGRIGRSAVPLAGEQPNDVRLGYKGSLNGAGNLVTLDGETFGKLKGSPIQGLVASSAPGETVTIGAQQVGATVTIVAEIP
jgi:hypothetical protein